MVAVYPVLSLLLIVALSLLIIRVGSVALRMTGLSPAVASFQAASAFSGAGYTTEEAESVVSVPERRTIVKTLIRLGSVGLVSVIASLVLSFTDTGADNALTLAYIVAGATALALLARSRWFNRLLTPIIERMLSRTTDLEIKDYTRMLGLREAYRVAEVAIGEDDWLANATPAEIDLAEEGVIMLGIQRGDHYIGAPGGSTEVRPGDVVVLYGKEERLQELAERTAADEQAHADAVDAHAATLERQERRLSP